MPGESLVAKLGLCYRGAIGDVPELGGHSAFYWSGLLPWHGSITRVGRRLHLPDLLEPSGSYPTGRLSGAEQGKDRPILIARRSFLNAGVLAASGLSLPSCRVSHAACALLGRLSLLDTSAKMSWELCWQRREARIEANDGFWSQRILHLPVHSLLGSDLTAESLLILDLGELPKASVLVCDLGGRIKQKFRLPERGRLDALRVDKSGWSVALVGPIRGPNQGGLYFRTEADPWRQVSNVNCSDVQGISFYGGDVVWGEKGAIWSVSIETSTKRAVTRGDHPCISPDGRHLYFRDTDKSAVVCKWPSLERIYESRGHEVGAVALWTPSGDALILERTVVFLETFALQPATGRDFSLGMIRSRGSGESGEAYLNLVDWGDEGPDLLKRFSIRE